MITDCVINLAQKEGIKRLLLQWHATKLLADFKFRDNSMNNNVGRQIVTYVIMYCIYYEQDE